MSNAKDDKKNDNSHTYKILHAKLHNKKLRPRTKYKTHFCFSSNT